MRMSVKSEEIKVVISASAGELKRELTAAEREMMKARGVMEQEGGKIAASSKVWSQYRSKTASELQKTLGEVERTQAKIDKLLEKGPAIRESEMSAYEAKLTAKGYSGETASRMTTEAAKRGDQLQGLQSVLAAQQASVQELTGSLSALNAKVAETTQTEQQEAQAARDAASAEKEHTQATGGGTSAAGSFLAALKKRVAGLLQFSHAARSAGQSASGIGRGGQSAGGGIAKIGRTAIMALVGVRGLYAGLRKLVSATANAAAHNRTLANSLGQIKGNLAIMFQSIFQAALPALQKLASFLAMVTSYVAQFTAMLFGVKWKTAVDGAKAASSGIGGVADNAKKASKAIHQMGIDELNILDREDDSDASGGGGGGGGIPAIYKEEDGPKFEWLDRLKEKLMPLIEKVKAALEKIRALFEAIKESFLSAWEKYGEPILNKIIEIAGNVIDSFGNIAEKIREAWENGDAGTRIFEGILGTIDGILGIVADVSAAFEEWTESADFTEILEALARLWESISELVNQIRVDFQPIWDGLIKSLGDSALQTAANLINAIATAIEGIQEAFSKENKGETFATNLSRIFSGIAGIAEGVSENFLYIVENIDYDNIATKVSEISGSIANIVENLEKLSKDESLDKLTSSTVNDVLKLTGDALLVIAGALETISALLAGDFTGAWEGFKKVLWGVYEAIMNIVIALIEGLADFVAAIPLVGDDWAEGLRKGAEGIREELKGQHDDFFGLNKDPGMAELVSDPMRALRDEASAYTSSLKAETSTAVGEGISEGLTEGVGSGAEEVMMLPAEVDQEQVILSYDQVKDVIETMKPTITLSEDGAVGYFNYLDEQIAFYTEGYFPVISFAANTEPLTSGVNNAVDSLPTEHTITVNFKMGSMPSFPKPGLAAGGGIIHAARGGIIPRLASGGSLGMGGQLFIAREAGPELVAGIGGGRTAVMNNDQIVKSVSDGVYKAVREAMAGGSFDVNVVSRLICDNREIAKAAEKGRASMGRQIGSRAFA